MARHVCPVWIGYLLISPVRKLFQNPKKILRPYIEKGMKVLDVGSAMGFFSLPLAQMVGSQGKVICVDVQGRMIQTLEKRARKAGLFDRITTRICTPNSFGLDDLMGRIDFALAFAVVHEVPDASNLFSEIKKVIKPGGKLLVVEPKGHVSERIFKITVSAAEAKGFKVIGSPKIWRSRTVLFTRKF